MTIEEHLVIRWRPYPIVMKNILSEHLHIHLYIYFVYLFTDS